MSRRPNLKVRERILRVALDLFHGRGFKGVSMEDVASAAGIKKANLFHYYPTKEDLGLAVLCRRTDCQKEMVREKFSDKGDPIRTVESMFLDSLARMKENRCSRGCFLGNLAQEISDYNEKLRRKVAECFGFWVQELASFLGCWQAKGYFRKNLRPRESAEAILSLLEGATLFSKANKQVGAIENARRMVAVYLGGYRRR